MTRDELKSILASEVRQIAPEIEFEDVDPTDDLRDALEIDSMDFQNLVSALHQRLGIPIPETDYEKLSSIDATLDYLFEETSRSG
ncbi:MAG: acyl carrier protein [Henriciella sp.]|nr:acyl carrier protein [Henriciella sp.]